MDYLLGAPYNIASYSALLAYMAHRTGHLAGNIHVFVGDIHLYVNHLDQIREQISYIDKSDMDSVQQKFVTYNVPDDLRNMDDTHWRIFNQAKGPLIKGKVAR